MAKEIIETVEEVNEVIELEEVKPEGFMSKVKAGAKKHGKKVAVAAGLVAATCIAYALGTKTGDSEDADYELIEDGSDSDCDVE